VQYHSVTVTVRPNYSSQHFVLKHTQVFDRKIFGIVEDEVSGKFRTLHNKEICGFYVT
jgi:hypothetical protein